MRKDLNRGQTQDVYVAIIGMRISFKINYGSLATQQISGEQMYIGDNGMADNHRAGVHDNL